MDNAGAFDNLIPLLPHKFRYVCIDLPGHGRSSHFPPHLPLHTLNFLLDIAMAPNWEFSSRGCIHIW
nr:unnamed protein product [Callosobruchus chinensis]